MKLQASSRAQMFFKLSDNILYKFYKTNKEEFPIYITDTLITKTPVVNEIRKWTTPEHSIQIPGNHFKNDPPYILKLNSMELICSTYKDHVQIYRRISKP